MTAVVLVHGLWSDGSVWSEVIDRLQRAGHDAVATQLPLTSLEDDVAAFRRTILAQEGPVAVVAWSYGGAVVTATDLPDSVAGLGFIAAFLPEVGESVGQIAHRRPTALLSSVRSTEDGYTWIDRAAYPLLMADDVDVIRAQARARVQTFACGAIMGTSFERTSWRNRSTHYLVASEDRALDAETQRELAHRAGSKLSELASGHTAMLSFPDEVAAFVLGIVEEVEQA